MKRNATSHIYSRHGGQVVSNFAKIESVNRILRSVGFNVVKPEDCIMNWYQRDIESMTTEQIGKLRYMAYKVMNDKDCPKKTRDICSNIRDRSVKVILKRVAEGRKNGSM